MQNENDDFSLKCQAEISMWRKRFLSSLNLPSHVNKKLLEGTFLFLPIDGFKKTISPEEMIELLIQACKNENQPS